MGSWGQRARARGGLPDGWAPTDITGSTAYHHPGTLGAEDSLVDPWTDSSGNGNDLDALAVGAEPVVKLNVLDGYKGLLFDGVNDQLIWPAAVLAGATTAAAYIVFVPKSGQNGDGLWQLQVASVAGGNWHPFGSDVYDAAFTDVRGNSSGGPMSNALPHCVVVIYNGTNLKIRLNGAQVFSGVANIQITADATHPTVGNGATGAYDGHVLEVGIWLDNDLESGTDQADLDAHLGSKYPTIGWA